MRVSQYEIYEGDSGQWALAMRFMPKDETLAKTQAETNWTQNRVPTILVQEGTADDSTELEISVPYRSPGNLTAIKPPDLDGSISGRVTMAVINGVLIGVLGGGLVGAGMSSVRLAIVAFIAVALLATLVLFRLLVPTEVMQWRNKTTDSKRKTIEALTAASNEDAPTAAKAAASQVVSRRWRRKGAFSHPIGEIPTTNVVPSSGVITDVPVAGGQTPEMATVAAVTSDLLQELINRQVSVLAAFSSDALKLLGPQVTTLQAFDRYGINLYIAGAAQEIAWREALTATTLQSILIGVLVDLGQSADSVRTFCERLAGAADRPRYQAMLEAGRAAMKATLDAQPVVEANALPTVLRTWSNPHDKAVAARRYAVLLTDMIGSTDATRKLGNSGAQRMLRAHNAIFREALKNHKGTEVKHTGDGILAIFDKSYDAVEAARAIQQEVMLYVKDNPDLPLSLRIGIEYGEGAIDGGEYFGDPFNAIEATCDAAGGGDIAVTALVRDQSAGANTVFVPLTPSPTAKSFVEGLFKLVWEPKRVYNAPPLEYGQIGTTITPPPPPQP